MDKFTVNGVEFAFRIDGEKSKPWLVLSNSLATDHRMWEPQMEALTQTHQILRYDTRGHGESPATDGAYSFDLLVGDLVALLDEVEIENADFMGLSLGGMTALGLTLDHPQRVNRLICCDARANAPDAYADFWRERIDMARNQGVHALVEGTLERWFTEAFRSEPGNQTMLELAAEMIQNTSLKGFCGCAAALRQLNYASRLAEIETPSLFIVGEDDLAAPPDVMAAMASSIAGAQMAVIENAAHLSNMNQPQEFSDTVSQWLAKP